MRLDQFDHVGRHQSGYCVAHHATGAGRLFDAIDLIEHAAVGKVGFLGLSPAAK